MWCILCILAHHVAKSYTKALFVFKLHRHMYNTTRYNIISWLSAYVASFCDMSRVTCHDVTRDMSGVTCHKLQPTHRSFTYVYNNGVPLMFSPKNVICGHFYAVKSLIGWLANHLEPPPAPWASRVIMRGGDPQTRFLTWTGLRIG